jgi:GxxExxY protein
LNDDELIGIILDAAFRIHTRLDPGLLESVYQRVLVYELVKQGLSVEVQKTIPIFYEDIHLEEGYRADLIVEKRILLELRSVESLLPVHVKQVLTYLGSQNLE